MTESTELFHIMHTTRAMRRLKPDPVPDELIHRILQAGQWAANGGANQRWRFLVVKDRSIKEQVQKWYQKAFDEVVGPRYRGSEPPPGSSPGRYRRQHDAVEYLTEHYHEAPVWIVACQDDGTEPPSRSAGASIYPAVQNMLLAVASAGPRFDAHQPAPAPREGGGGDPGPAARRALLRHPAHRLPHGQLRPGAPGARWRTWCTWTSGARSTSTSRFVRASARSSGITVIGSGGKTNGGKVSSRPRREPAAAGCGARGATRLPSGPAGRGRSARRGGYGHPGRHRAAAGRRRRRFHRRRVPPHRVPERPDRSGGRLRYAGAAGCGAGLAGTGRRAHRAGDPGRWWAGSCGRCAALSRTSGDFYRSTRRVRSR